MKEGFSISAALGRSSVIHAGVRVFGDTHGNKHDKLKLDLVGMIDHYQDMGCHGSPGKDIQH